MQYKCVSNELFCQTQYFYTFCINKIVSFTKLENIISKNIDAININCIECQILEYLIQFV